MAFITINALLFFLYCNARCMQVNDQPPVFNFLPDNRTPSQHARVMQQETGHCYHTSKPYFCFFRLYIDMVRGKIFFYCIVKYFPEYIQHFCFIIGPVGKLAEGGKKAEASSAKYSVNLSQSNELNALTKPLMVLTRPIESDAVFSCWASAREIVKKMNSDKNNWRIVYSNIG
jgi:hypothetical protein